MDVERLTFLNRNMNYLWLALHGTTEKKETTRSSYYQNLGRALPQLILPAHNAALYNEFQALARFLERFGLPQVENVCMAEADFQWAQDWLIELNTRMFDVQEQTTEQTLTLFASLARAKKDYESLGQYPAALKEVDYQGMHGALTLLEMMVGKGSIPCSELLECVEAVHAEIVQLRKQLKNTFRKHAGLRD